MLKIHSIIPLSHFHSFIPLYLSFSSLSFFHSNNFRGNAFMSEDANDGGESGVMSTNDFDSSHLATHFFPHFIFTDDFTCNFTTSHSSSLSSSVPLSSSSSPLSLSLSSYMQNNEDNYHQDLAINESYKKLWKLCTIAQGVMTIIQIQ